MKIDTDCEYYPCHSHLDDCTFCFCPFYPCLDDLTGGRFVVSEKTEKDVWSCKRCEWIHKKDVIRELLREIENIKEDDRNALLELRLKILE
jgi:precorrin-3B C17-methyltransferase